MCHSEIAPDQIVGEARREPVAVPLEPGEEMPGVLTLPEGERCPPVLLIADMYGPSPFYESLAARLAVDGIEVLLPDYFFRLPPLERRDHGVAVARRRGLDESRSVDDLRAALSWLRSRPGYAGRIGVLGFCMGGTFALDLAAFELDLVTVAYYGFPVPQPELASPPPAPLDLAEQIAGPVLAFWGQEDAVVGHQTVERFIRRMEEAGKDFVHQTYAGLGHGFLQGADLAAAALSDEPASRSWALTLDHFRRHLKAGSAT